MLDGRVLAAVLASLTAIAAGLGGGGLSMDQVKDSTISAPGSSSFADLSPDSLNLLDRFIEKPEPENEMNAVLVSENLKEEEFSFKGASISTSDFRRIKFSGKTLESEESIELYGFTGTLNPGNATELKGQSSGLLTGGVNVSGGFDVMQEIEAGALDVKGIEKSEIELESASIDLKTESDDYTTSAPRNVKINSFSGDMRIYFSNSTILLDGKVDRLESGDFSFGG